MIVITAASGKLGRAVATALSQRVPASQISGREVVSARELAVLMSEQTGRAIEAVDVPLQAFADQFRAMGLPEWVVTGLTSFFATIGGGEYARTSDAVEQLSGRPSTSPGDYLKATA